MSDQLVLYGAKQGLATVVVNRPKAHNAFDRATGQAIIDAIHRAADDASVRCVILAATGPSFSAGGDFNWVLSWKDNPADQIDADARFLSEVVHAIYELPKPTIARVQGAAVGGGLGIMLACDFAIAAEEARIGVPSAHNGLLASIIVPFLVQAVGARKARQLMLTGTIYPAKSAMTFGLVDAVVPAAQLDAAVLRLAAELLKGAPGVQAAIKSLITEVDAREVNEALIDLIAPYTAKHSAGEEAQEGMSAFLKKRKPAWAPE